MSPDDLKSLDQLCVADARQSAFVVLDTRTGAIHPKTIEDHYSVIEGINLGNSVPTDIRIHFETSRNLLLYAWFVYRFIPVAQLHAYETLEFALRMRLAQTGKIKGNRSLGLRQLLRYAIGQDWIRDEGIRQFRRIEERRADYRSISSEGYGDDPAEAATVEVQAYSRILAEVIPSLRNDLAHGSGTLTLMGSAYLTLEICCDLINQLFTAKNADFRQMS